MVADEVQSVFKQFGEIASDFEAEHLTSGHINRTYLINNGGKRYILQRINTDIFKNLEDIMGNISAIANHLEEKAYPRRILKPLRFSTNELLADKKWRLFPFFEKTQTFEKVETSKQAYEAASFISEFYSFLTDLNPQKIKDSIPGFLNFDSRYQAFVESLEKAGQERLEKAKKEIDLVKAQQGILNRWNSLLEDFPDRVIHADPKISNFLFKEGEANTIEALIDWDTLMSGPILYDFGDMVRSYTNLKAEDDPNESGNNFSGENYEALKKGFLTHLRDKLEPVELDNLDLAGQAVIYVQAIRFLTDYLNNDVYYAVKHPEQNLDRTKNQLNLLKELNAAVA